MFYCIEGLFNMETITNSIRKKNTGFLMIVDYMESVSLYMSVKCAKKPDPIEDIHGNPHEWGETRLAFKGGNDLSEAGGT